MLKIKLIMAALLAIGFAGQTFASDEEAPAKPAAKKRVVVVAAGVDINAVATPKPAKWTAAQCAEKCTKAKCKGLSEDAEETATPTPAQAKVGMVAGLACSLNCKSPDKAATLVDCVIPLYAAKCLSIKVEAAEGKAKKFTNCHHLSNAVSAIIVGPVYLQRENAAKPEAAAAWDALKALDTSANAG
ncbi:MAG: hypothetical protein V4482_06605 [Pseudomonadota bacterium]